MNIPAGKPALYRRCLGQQQHNRHTGIMKSHRRTGGGPSAPGASYLAAAPGRHGSRKRHTKGSGRQPAKACTGPPPCRHSGGSLRTLHHERTDTICRLRNEDVSPAVFPADDARAPPCVLWCLRSIPLSHTVRRNRPRTPPYPVRGTRRGI